MKRLLYLLILLVMQLAFISMVFKDVPAEGKKPTKRQQDTIEMIYQKPNTVLVEK